jgi:NTE family protein
MTTAFVLAGGGSLGAVEAGMLRALVEHGERADFVVGASAGAINGAYFAAEPTPAGVSRLEAIWCGLKREHIFPFGLQNLLGMLWRREYLVESHGLRKLLEGHLSYARLEDAAIPIHVIATDLLTGGEVVLSSGCAVDAVLASAAIPGIFPTVVIDGRELVDGSVTNNTPISSAVKLGADRIVVLPTGFACGLMHAPKGAIAKALHSLNLLVARQLVHDIERYAQHVTLHIVPTLCPAGTSSYDYSGCAALIDRARQSTRQWIADGGLNRATTIPRQLRDHTHH